MQLGAAACCIRKDAVDSTKAFLMVLRFRVTAALRNIRFFANGDISLALLRPRAVPSAITATEICVCAPHYAPEQGINFIP